MEIECKSCKNDIFYTDEVENIIDKTIPTILVNNYEHRIVGVKINDNCYCWSCIEYNLEFMKTIK